MKKIILSTLIFLGCLLASAQEKVGTYHSSLFRKDFDVSVTKEKVFINVGGERMKDEVRMVIKRGDVKKFVKALTQVKEKYLEWKKVAEENEVVDFIKEFDVKFPPAYFEWFSSTGRWASYYQDLKPNFVVLKEYGCAFNMNDVVSASENQFIEQHYMFSLSEASDFDSLIEVLDPEKAEEVLNKKQNIDELFK